MIPLIERQQEQTGSSLLKYARNAIVTEMAGRAWEMRNRPHSSRDDAGVVAFNRESDTTSCPVGSWILKVAALCNLERESASPRCCWHIHVLRFSDVLGDEWRLPELLLIQNRGHERHDVCPWELQLLSSSSVSCWQSQETHPMDSEGRPVHDLSSGGCHIFFGGVPQP